MSTIFLNQGVNMDATLVLKLDRVIEQLKSLKNNSESMANPLDKDIDNQIWFDDVEQLEYAIKLIDVLKLNHEDVSKCVELLSIDGKGSKTTVKEKLTSYLDRLIGVFE